MIRQTILKQVQPALRSTVSLSKRTFAVSAYRMAEGDTGGVRAGGAATGDAFNKREQANENMEIKKRETEKLMALKEKIQAQQKHLKDLSDHIDQMSEQQGGGEKN